jgi:mono/diheme cytochrome c family protein
MQIYKNVYIILTAVLFIFLLQGCSKKQDKETDEKKDTTSALTLKGKEIFYTLSTENNLTCSECHSDGTNLTNPLTNYFPDIKGANKRTSVYNGKYKANDVTDNASGATICWQKYLLMKRLLTDEEILSLNAYYASISSGNEPTEIKYNTIALPEPNKDKLKEEQKAIASLKGNSKNGEDIFKKACNSCHGNDSKIKKVPDLFKDFDGDASSVTYMVRFGKKFMPFFSYDKISTQDIADITAYILSKKK